MDNERAKLLQELYEAIDKKDEENIRILKSKNLIHGSNLFDVIINYLMLCYAGVDVDFGCKVLKKGTKLYRIRRYIEGVDFSDPPQWDYPPHMPENRANREGEPALYLGSSETVCLLETHISKEECYCLGEYVVQEDIELGGFLDVEDRNSTTWILIGVILNAFLISPARGDKNDGLFNYLDQRYRALILDDLRMTDVPRMDLPLKFATINKKNHLYKLTNQLIDHVKTKYPEGLRYSSCYLPIETIGIECSDYNVVLYSGGMKKLKYIGFKKKVQHDDFAGLDVIKVLLEKTQL